METVNKHRYIWIDWMKVLGLYFIILGHFHPTYQSYIYAFNVPIFFIISGFLSKKEPNIKTFYNKILHNLIIPAIIILIINFIWDISIKAETTLIDIPKRIINVFIGMHGTHRAGGGLGPLWYVYTLIILKIIYQICSKKIQLLLLIALPLVAILLHYKSISFGNAILNTTVAYPFWCIGLFFRQRLEQYRLYEKHRMNILLILSIIMLYIAGQYNNSPWMYINEYGNYFSLFIIGALSGTFIIYYISKKLEIPPHKTKYLKLLSSGSIIILGIHYIFIDIILLCSGNTLRLSPIIYSFIIMISFIPINILLKKYFPIIFGKRL